MPPVGNPASAFQLPFAGTSPFARPAVTTATGVRPFGVGSLAKPVGYSNCHGPVCTPREVALRARPTARPSALPVAASPRTVVERHMPSAVAVASRPLAVSVPGRGLSSSAVFAGARPQIGGLPPVTFLDFFPAAPSVDLTAIATPTVGIPTSVRVQSAEAVSRTPSVRPLPGVVIEALSPVATSVVVRSGFAAVAAAGASDPNPGRPIFEAAAPAEELQPKKNETVAAGQVVQVIAGAVSAARAQTGLAVDGVSPQAGVSSIPTGSFSVAEARGIVAQIVAGLSEAGSDFGEFAQWAREAQARFEARYAESEPGEDVRFEDFFASFVADAQAVGEATEQQQVERAVFEVMGLIATYQAYDQTTPQPLVDALEWLLQRWAYLRNPAEFSAIMAADVGGGATLRVQATATSADAGRDGGGDGQGQEDGRDSEK